MPVFFQHQLLIQARVELSLTQEEAARAVGVDVRTYRRYESGEVNQGGSFGVQRASRRQIVERMCRELGIAEAELLTPLELSIALSSSLPRARHFVGRRAELSRLAAWLGDAASRARVLAIVAMGGAGKTSLLEQAVTETPTRRAPFVHSFYDEPSVDVFLSAAASHLGEARGEPLDDLLSGLRREPSATLVLDGLELVQADGEGDRARGELTDRRLVRLLRAVVREPALGRLLITSRFPLADLSAFEGAALETLALAPLDTEETRVLLDAWGVRASGATLGAVHAHTGGHALSLSVIGAYAAEVLDGDLGAAQKLDLADAARDQPLARKLSLMLDRYAAELVTVERQLLGCVCLHGRGATLEALARLPLLERAPELELRAGLSRLVSRGLVVKVGDRYSAHPFIRAHFAGHFSDAPAIRDAERARLAAQLTARPEHRPEGARFLDDAEQLFEHTLGLGDVSGAFRVLERTLGGFSHLGLRLGEFERGLRLTRALERGLSQLPADDQWRLLYNRGLYAAALGDLDDALRAYRALLARSEDNTTTHRTLAYTLRLRGELELGHVHVERSIELGRQEGAPGSVARGLALRGAFLTSEGRLDEARAAFAEARALGDAPVARRAIWEAELWLASGDAERATAQTLENLEACREREWAGHVAHCHVILGRAAVARGARQDAEDALDAARDWCRRSKEVELSLEAQLLELSIARASGDRDRATHARALALDTAIAGGYGFIRSKLSD